MANQSLFAQVEAQAARLQQLLGFLEHDPDNPRLLADAAAAALDARVPESTIELLARADQIAPLSPALRNLLGMAFMQAADHVRAAEIFAALIAEGFDDPNLRFNLAWARAVTGDHQGALDVLDDAAVAISPRGPALKVQCLHHLGRLSDALEKGALLAAANPTDQLLLGSLSAVAMDAGELDLAADYAMRGGDSEDALATQGMLRLGDYAPDEALARFDRALELAPDQPRAWVGRGLALLTRGEAAEAAPCIERGAALFGHHLGSWIAAGWAHIIAGDPARARACFERAVAIDENFGEGHGGLAYIDLLEGNWAAARRKVKLALGLDRRSLSGALVSSLLAEHDANPALAQKIRDRAMATSIGPGGENLTEAVIRMGAGLRR